MKKILGFLAAFAALFLFVAPSYADDEGGTIRRTTGRQFSLGSPSATTTTYDVWPIGFQAKWVRVCGQPAAIDTVWIRLADSVSSENGSVSVAPAGTSGAFIGTTVAGVSERALPFSLEISSGDVAATSKMVRCETRPWRTRGLVVHNVSGTATLDAWAW